jgi:uncharacterized protein
MTPQERQLVADLFDRLATLENAPRDADAERAIAEGLARAPNAPYALVQTVLVQDEALKQADARIRELEAALGAVPGAQAGSGGFLDTMRDSLFGRREGPHGSVPTVRPQGAPMGVPPGFRTDAAQTQTQSQPGAPYPQEQRGGGGSFLGTAAAAAAGVIGGSLLLDGIRSMMGNRPGGFGALDQAAASESRSPWGASASDTDLARQAGLDDIGRGGSPATQDAGATSGFGLLDDNESDVDADDDLDIDDSLDIGGDSDST